MITIYHNPRCSKSRETLELVSKQKEEVKVIEYLQTPPDKKELQKILKSLGIKASQLVRKSEQLYKDNYKDRKISEAEWLKILVENPILIERPIVVKGNKAMIGRPPEIVLEIL
ncbi:MAG: arsenate reductase (glutaredoxin) [Cytophagaceae bacterium]